MKSIIEIKNISDLNKMLGQEEPIHPLIGIEDSAEYRNLT